ncbi:MAG: LysR substrate-binding domain-containing protein [Sporomusaceae bacterium]|nr:LysR substrate-binding domain-containing protein [Sporomusaceae bacterium]
MDLDDINIFRAVALYGSMTQAAEVLGYAQSSVTARIRKLEAALKVNLLYRHAKGVQLTPAGRIFLEQGLKITRLTEELPRLLSLNSVPEGLLRLGSMETTAAIRLPALLKYYHTHYDRVELSLHTDTSEGLINKILTYELDLAFVASPVNHPELDEFEAFREELVLVSASGQEQQPISEILRQRTILVFRAGCSYRLLLERYLLELRATALKRFEFGSLEAIIGGVAAGIGISLLPRSVVDSRLRTGELSAYELPVHLRYCPTLLIRRKDAVQTAASASFLDLARGASAF